MKTKISLPLFPGFYHTLLAIDEEGETYHLLEDGMTDSDVVNVEYDIAAYEKQAGEAWNDLFEVALKEAIVEGNKEVTDPDAVIEVTFERIKSPRQYNFGNDECYSVVSFNNEIVMNTYSLAIDKLGDERFQELIDERFKSRSGFVSFYSSDIDDWRPDVVDFEKNVHIQFAMEVILVAFGDEDDMQELSRNISMEAIDGIYPETTNVNYDTAPPSIIRE